MRSQGRRSTTYLEIKEQFETVQGDYNYCLGNPCRSRSNGLSWHAIDEPEMCNVGMAHFDVLACFYSGVPGHRIGSRPERTFRNCLMVMAGLDVCRMA